MPSVKLKSSEEIEIIRSNGEVLGQTHAEVARMIAPGVTTAALDARAETFIRDHGGTPSFKGYNGFPASLCISVNENVVHGFPSAYTLQEGDIVSVDCGVYRDGFHADSAYTYPVGEVKPEIDELLKATREALYLGIEACRHGNRMGDISHAIQHHVESLGFTVVRELVGHGVGASLHEAPEVPNFGRRGRGPKLTNGMVLAIEPMINLGKRNVVQERDGWTIRTKDRQPSAHFEHTVAIYQGAPLVLTTFDYIEEVFTV